MRLAMRLDTSPTSDLGAPQTPAAVQSAEGLDVRVGTGLLLAAAVLLASDLHGLDSPAARLASTVLVTAVLAPMALRWWRSMTGVTVLGIWLALSVSNLISPLRSIRSAQFLTTTVLSIVLIVHVARLVGSDRLRRFVTAYVTVFVFFALFGLAAIGLAAGSFRISDLRIDMTAVAIWKAVVILSPCPIRSVPARVAFAGFKVVLVLLMIGVDRPKLGVLLALGLGLAAGAFVSGLHRTAMTRSIIPACVGILPLVGIIAVVSRSWPAIVSARGSDFSGRMVLWRVAKEEMDRAGSILGVGFRNSLSSGQAVRALSPRFDGALETWGNAVHNVYLQLLVELGILGVAVVAIVLAVSIMGLLRIKSAAKQASLATDLVFLLALCMVEPVLEPNRIVFVLLILTFLRILQHSAEEGSPLLDLGAADVVRQRETWPVRSAATARR